MSAFTGEHSSERVPQKSRHRRAHVLSPGTAKKMMISGSGLHEEVQSRPNDLQEVLRKAASEGCEATQEEVRSHQPVQGAVECALSCQLALHEELKDQWQSDAAAQKKHSCHQMKRAMYGTRRASRLFQEHMKGVLGEARCAALKVRHQVYHCLEADSTAAIHGDDILAEGEPEKLNRLDEVLKRLVDVKSA